MLKREQRLTKELLNNLMKNSRFSGTKSFSLRYSFTSNTPKIGVTVSKKISKTAVGRNLLRRRVQAILKDEISQLKAGLYQIIAKPGSAKLKSSLLHDEISLLLKPFKKE